MTKKYWKTSLDNFYNWQGQGANPAIGTVNQILGYHDGSPDDVRYTKPYIYKDSTCQYDAAGMPINGTIIGVQQDIMCRIDDNCPAEKRPTGLLTLEEYEALDWINEED